MCECDKNITTTASQDLNGDFDLSNLELKRYMADKQPPAVTMMKSLVVPMPLSGVVVDDYGDPVMGAHVAISATEGTVTDVNGRFSFPAVLPLTPLTVSHLSHKNITLPATNNMRVELEPGITELDELVVTAHKKSRFPGFG